MLDGKEGLCGSAPRHDKIVRKYSLKSFESICEAERGKLEDIVGINVPLYARIHGRVKTICVSNGFTREDSECLGFIHAGASKKQWIWHTKSARKCESRHYPILRKPL